MKKNLLVFTALALVASAELSAASRFGHLASRLSSTALLRAGARTASAPSFGAQGLRTFQRHWAPWKAGHTFTRTLSFLLFSRGKTQQYYKEFGALLMRTDAPEAIAAWLKQKRQERGFSIDNPVNEKGNTYLTLAAEKNLYEVMKVLLENGANPNVQGEYKQTPLFFLLENRESVLPGVRLLLKHGADPLVANICGKTSLHVAVRRDQPYSVVEALVAKGGTTLVRTRIGEDEIFNRGTTALHLAVQRWEGGEDIVKLLLQYGADPFEIDGEGRNALMLAKSHLHQCLSDYIESRALGGNHHPQQPPAEPAKCLDNTHPAEAMVPVKLQLRSQRMAGWIRTLLYGPKSS